MASMRIDDWLRQATLALADIPTARLDALVLLGDALGQDKAWILAHPEATLTDARVKKLATQLQQRSGHEPLAYIREKVAFYGREFDVTKQVLVPRPESETMIDLLKSLPLPEKPKLADIGTGCGALGITAALELPGATLTMTDIDAQCLTVAAQNAQKYDIIVELTQGDLLQTLPPVPYPLDAILANLPYVPDSHTINQAAMIEPKIAIFGGEDGLDLYRHMFQQLSEKTWRPSFILTESLPFQHESLKQIAADHGFKQTQEDDFIQIFAPVMPDLGPGSIRS